MPAFEKEKKRMPPKLSVCFITYNHEKYIRQALESVLMQQCDFDFEVVIGNDCSTDGTTAIVEEFATRYPEKIRLNVIEKNVGMTANWLSTVQACTGEYVAMLEGDDFWTDPLKLQKQVDFLDKHPEYSFVAHDLGVLHEEGVQQVDELLHFTDSRAFTIHELIPSQIFLQTSSLVFRRKMLGHFDKWVDKRVKSIDLVFFLMLSAQAPFYYLAEKMSVYRMHVGGVSNIYWRTKRNMVEFDMAYIFINFNSYSRGKFKNEIEDKLEGMYLRLIKNNPPTDEAHARALKRLFLLRPSKHLDLVKGFIINRYIPPALYSLYRKVM